METPHEVIVKVLFDLRVITGRAQREQVADEILSALKYRGLYDPSVPLVMEPNK